MSKYKYEFGVSTNKIGSECSEIIDLVDDWGYEEEKLDALGDEAFALLMDSFIDEFIANSVDMWAKPIDGSRDH